MLTYATYRMVNITGTQQIQGGSPQTGHDGRNGNMDLELENNKGVLARLELALRSQDANWGLRGSFPQQP